MLAAADRPQSLYQLTLEGAAIDEPRGRSGRAGSDSADEIPLDPLADEVGPAVLAKAFEVQAEALDALP
jgi:hypothetical protein